MAVQQLDLARHRGLGDRHVDFGPAEVAVPFGDLVLQDQVIAERVPGQRRPRGGPGARRRAVGENEVGLDGGALSVSNQSLIAAPCQGKKPSRKSWTSTCGAVAPPRGRRRRWRGPRLARAGVGRQHAPSDVEPHAGGLQIAESCRRSRSRCRRSARRGTAGARGAGPARPAAAPSLAACRSPGPGQPGHVAPLDHVLEHLLVPQRVHGAPKAAVAIGDELALLDQPLERLDHQLFALAM